MCIRDRGITVNGLRRRFDLVVYDTQGTPLILIECKAPTVKLEQKTFDQVSAYNLKVKAPYLSITNGIDTFCAEINFEDRKYDMLTRFPTKQ